jgi:hypothetical protein
MQCISGVPTCNKTRLLEEILHLDIKYHMTANLFVGWRDSLIPIQYFKHNPDVLHILTHWTLPNSVAIFFVQYYAVILTLRDLNSKFVIPLVIFLGDSGDDAAAHLENM